MSDKPTTAEQWDRYVQHLGTCAKRSSRGWQRKRAAPGRLTPAVAADMSPELGDFETSIRLLKHHRDQCDQPWPSMNVLASAVLAGAIRALEARAYRYLCGPKINNEHAVLTMIHHVAGDLRTSGQALLSAAGALKSAGKGMQASTAYIAGQRALEAAEALTDGSDG